MASLERNGSGWRIQYMDSGQRRRGPTFPTQEAALGWQRDHLPAIGKRHLMELAQVWRDECPTAHRTEAAHQVARLVASRGWGDVHRLTLPDVVAWLHDDEAWSPRVCQYLRTVLRWAADVHHLPVRTEVLAWRPPPRQRTAKPPLLTDQHLAVIMAAATELGPRALAIVQYLATYGARPITACRLRMDALDLDRCELELGRYDRDTGRRGEKHSGGWRHAVDQSHVELWASIAASWPRPDDSLSMIPVFPHYREDRPWRIQRGSAQELADWYKNTIGKRAKLGKFCGIYHLKRWAISRMFRAGLDPATIASFTGHLDLEQLMTYNTTNHDRQMAALPALVGGLP